MARRTKLQLEAARKRALAARKAHLKKMHRMTPEQYESLKAFQGGLCGLCLRAKGVYKNLAVEHDHAQAILDGHPANESCPLCWRGLACGMCNKFLGFARDDPAMFLRFHSWVIDPPAQHWRKIENTT